jgi:hypothetical protein
MARAASNPDLFAIADIEDARIEAERAENRRVAARRKVDIAPHGQKSIRLKAFLEATEDALRAENQLRRLMREADLG